MQTVEIANPAPGGQSYTSPRKANEFIRRGRARFENGQLMFIDRATVKRLREEAGMVFWNGDVKDPCAMKKPGEVRS